MPTTTLHLLISGRVQGVWYRGAMHLEAERLGVAGWVRNRRDGSVEAVVQGEASVVAALVAWARTGPPAARVDEVLATATEGDFSHFERLPTA
jgi:acylphosphatase